MQQMHSMSDISGAASAFVASYAAAMALGADPSNTLPAVADALASHYPLSTTFTALAFGTVSLLPDRAKSAQSVLEHLERFAHSGLGIDIFMEKHRIEVVSPGSALCWITWAIRPSDGTKGWNWENVYGYRRVAGLEGSEPIQHWEFAIADHEIGELLQRKPSIMTF